MNRNSEKAKHVALNQQEYGERYRQIKWVTDQEAQAALKERTAILEAIAPGIEYRFHRTKLVYRDLSPGCRLCGQGSWSCLFINSLCNGKCFFCPSPQDSQSEPSSNGVPFPHPRDYADYIKKFKIEGASISGGEPLLTFERSLAFVAKLKKTFDSSLYLWLYTNGLLLDPEKLFKLRQAGLDEMRFNLIASHYDLSRLKLAVRVIPHVTVEIPAIPDHEERLQRLVHELQDLGVHFLNLHHLRCTPHNSRNIIQKGYTLLHGPKATVLESELTALRIMRYVVRNRVALPVNYCSFVYKNGAQTLAYRRRLAALICKPFEDITDLGVIRRMSVRGQPAEMEKLALEFKKKNLPAETLYFDSGQDRLFFNQAVLPQLDLKERSLWVAYYLPALMPALSYQNPFEEIWLNKKKKIVIERKQVLPDQELQGEAADFLRKYCIAKPSEKEHILEQKSPRVDLKNIEEWEHFRPGLQEYY